MLTRQVIKKYILTPLPLLLMAIAIFYLSYNVIYTNDSITYQYSFATGERIESLIDIFPSQYAHYFSWNGRTVAHFICQVVLALMGKGMYALLNAAAYVLLILGIIKIAKASVNFRTIAFTTALVAFSFNLDFAPNYQISYIWMSVLVLLYLYLLDKVENHHLDYISIFGLFILSILAGNAHETICIGVGGALIIFTLLNIRSLNKAQWAMIIGFGIGGLFLCLSPASINRGTSQHIPLVMTLFHFIEYTRSLYILIILLIYKLIRREITLRDYYVKNAFLITAILILLLFNFIIGVGSNSQFVGIELFSCILVIRTLGAKPINYASIAIGGIMALGIFYMKVLESDKSKICYDQLYEAIAKVDGDKIYIDFPEFNPMFKASPVFRNGLYLDYIITSIQTEQCNSLRAPKKKLNVYPQVFRDIESMEVKNQILEYLPGEFMLIQDKANPANFTLHRELSLMGFRITLPATQISPKADGELDTDAYNIMYLPRVSPFIRNTNVVVNN